jgi:hypothetical protein
MARQHFGDQWANAGAIVAPDAGEIGIGWTFAKPFHQWMNWLFNRSDQMLDHLETHGVARWDALTTYVVDGLCLGSDGTIYQAVLQQAGNDPTLDDGTNWRQAIAHGDFTSPNGYVMFGKPGGARPSFIIQWGTNNVPANTVGLSAPVVLPIAYPTAHVFAAATYFVGVTDQQDNISAGHQGNLTTIYLENGTDFAFDLNWVSMGW